MTRITAVESFMHEEKKSLFKILFNTGKQKMVIVNMMHNSSSTGRELYYYSFINLMNQSKGEMLHCALLCYW